MFVLLTFSIQMSWFNAVRVSESATTSNSTFSANKFSVIALAVSSEQPSASSPISHSTHWVSYVRKVTNDCLHRLLHQKSTQVTFRARLANCVREHRSLLGCENSETLRVSSGEPLYTLPCGQIIQNLRKASSPLTADAPARWTISVFRLFYIELYFAYFTLPLPIRYCNPDEVVEFVALKGFDQNKQKSTKVAYFCGKILPFHLVISSSQATIRHVCLMPNLCTGFFRVQYQVQGRVQPSDVLQTVSVITDQQATLTSEVQRTGLSDKPVVFTTPIVTDAYYSRLVAVYNIHVVVDRLATMQLRTFLRQKIAAKAFTITAFEGPGSSVRHLHPESHLFSEGKQIFSASFQMFVQIRCLNDSCFHLTLQYVRQWTGPADLDIALEMYEATSPNMQHTLWYPHWCRPNKHPLIVRCLIKVSSPTFNIQVSLDYLSLSNPDYFGDRANEERCTIAGVTIMDEVRFKLLSDSRFRAEQIIEGISDRDAIERMFPEVTICGKVPLFSEESSTLKSDWPIGNFTTTYRSLLVLFYAYGAYMDIDQFAPILEIATTDCVGYTVGCFPVLRDSHVRIGDLSFNQRVQSIPEQPGDANILFYELARYVEPTEQHSSVIFIYKSTDVGVSIEVLLSDVQYSCVTFTHSATLAQHLDTVCLLRTAKKFAGRQTVSVRSAIPAIPTCLDVPNTFRSSVFTVEVSEILFSYSSLCLNYNVKAQIKGCAAQEYPGRVYLTAEMVKIDITVNDFGDQSLYLACHEFRVNISRSNMYFASVVNYFHELRLQKGRLSWLGSSMAGEILGRTHLMHTLWNMDADCQEECRQYTLYVTYADPTKERYVLLTWHVHLHNSLKVEVSQTSFVLWGLYITAALSAGTKHTCETGSCQLHVYTNTTWSFEDSAGSIGASLNSSGVASFAAYHFLWGPSVHSWTEAETICRSSGMHLPSIANEKEYDIVKGFLWGQGYSVDDVLKEDWIATPCKVESVICLVYLGLQLTKVLLKC